MSGETQHYHLSPVQEACAPTFDIYDRGRSPPPMGLVEPTDAKLEVGGSDQSVIIMVAGSPRAQKKVSRSARDLST